MSKQQDSRAAQGDKVPMRALSKQERSGMMWNTLRKVVLFCAAAATLICAAIGCYAVRRENYHAADLPYRGFFDPSPLWYTEDNLPDHPAINVVEDNPDHDEYHFMSIYDVTPDEDGIEPENPEQMSHYGFAPEPGHEYAVEIYCRNGADPIYNTDGYGFAKNVRLQVYLPHKYTAQTRFRKWLDGEAYVFPDYIAVDITADNVFPVATSNNIEFYSSEPLRLKYVKGSAKCYSADYPEGYELGEQLFEPGGVTIGQNGTIFGGREYACTVKFRFTVSKTTWYPWDGLIYDYHR